MAFRRSQLPKYEKNNLINNIKNFGKKSKTFQKVTKKIKISTCLSLRFVYKVLGILFWFGVYFTYTPIELTETQMQKIHINAIVSDEAIDDIDFGEIQDDQMFASVFSQSDKLDFRKSQLPVRERKKNIFSRKKPIFAKSFA